MINLLKPLPVPERPKKMVFWNRVSKSTKKDVLTQVSKYDVAVALSNSPGDMNFWQLFREDSVDSNKELTSKFPKNWARTARNANFAAEVYNPVPIKVRVDDPVRDLTHVIKIQREHQVYLSFRNFPFKSHTIYT